MSFASLGLSEALVSAVTAAGYAQPTPVQQRAIPAVLQKRDLMVAAQTGTGKTGGFALPILELLFPGGQPCAALPTPPRQVRVLVLTPTRELAAQVHDSFRLYARKLSLKSACIFGGVGMGTQIKALAVGLDVLVACPGRLLDLAAQDCVDLSKVDTLVLDEADRMLDMGFIHDVKKVIAYLPHQRQNLLFSATFSNDILTLANKLLKDPERIDVTPPNTTVERIEQYVYRLAAGHKRALLAHLIRTGNWEQILVFTRTKHGANRLAEYLEKQGLPAAAIHGNKSQNARTRALADFKDNKIRVLVATDIAARGLDIDQLPHVVNFELPNVEEDYVHRIGRTGRAGRNGAAVSLVAPEEDKLLRSIERLIQRQLPEGDWMGFDSATLNTEKRDTQQADKESATRSDPVSPEYVEPARPSRPKTPRTNNRRTAPPATEDHTTHSAKKWPNNRTNKPRGRYEKSAAPSSPGFLSAPRDPEEFLDDEVDNFGNRVDYVSPYPPQKNSGNRNHRTGTPRQPYTPATDGAKTAARPRKPASGQPQAQHAAQTKRRTDASYSNKAPVRKPRPAGARSYTPERQLTPFERVAPSEPKTRARQPVIVHKESKLDRLSPEQLEQLEQSKRNQQSTEKPLLLKRNPSS